MPDSVFGRDAAGVAWRPTAEHLSESRVARFLQREGADLESIQGHAVNDPAWFWREALDDLDLRWQRQPDAIFELDGDGWAFPRWWIGGSFNHALASLAAGSADQLAVSWEGEDGEIRRLSWAELDQAVRGAAAGFAATGIAGGTRVGVLLPMLPETVITVLALGLVEAVFTPIFSGYAAPAIATRLRAFEATHLITADGFLRRGRWVPLKTTADEAVAAAGSVECVVVVQRAGDRLDGLPMQPARDRWWHDVVGAGASSSDGPGTRTETDPETPYMVIYTSGTTGVPKGTVHVHGGFPIKAAQDLAHTFDLRRGDGLFWFTDLGWMMGPWEISGALLLGAAVVLYEGAPDSPGADRLWAVASRHGVTHMGVSPTLIRALLVHGDGPARAHDLSALRILGSTGEPWNPGPWRWLFETVGRGRLPIVNYTGGTEVSGGILGNTVVRPIKPAGFNGPCLGMAADVADPGTGAPVRGDVGELVLRGPWPGMTRGFWGGDTDRYLDAYWRRMPGTWVHGDWAQIDADGHWFLLGRSDDTLKIAGKRVGPAEVETAAVGHPAVVEAAAIGVPDELKGEAVVVLVVLRPRTDASPDVLREIAARVVRDLGPTLRPRSVVAVPGLPKTRSGKVMRRIARAAFLGTDPGDTSSLENPDAVSAIAAAATTRGAGGSATA